MFYLIKFFHVLFFCDYSKIEIISREDFLKSSKKEIRIKIYQNNYAKYSFFSIINLKFFRIDISKKNVYYFFD